MSDYQGQSYLIFNAHSYFII